jgi:hypothetical protein
MLDEFVNSRAKMPHPERDDVIQALRFDREDEAFGESIEVRAARGQSQRVDAVVFERGSEVPGEERGRGQLDAVALLTLFAARKPPRS